uniref:Uncharacterized protein n=1 Tax=Anguilla anguilla TaxID=7936 RepID=A0A0E9T8L0_ANGAN
MVTCSSSKVVEVWNMPSGLLIKSCLRRVSTSSCNCSSYLLCST